MISSVPTRRSVDQAEVDAIRSRFADLRSVLVAIALASITIPSFAKAAPSGGSVPVVGSPALSREALSVALVEAARHSDEGAVRALLRRGANPDHVMDGWTPLISACFFGHTPVVQALLDYSANTAIAEPTAGFSPLMLAIVNGHLDAAKLLVECRADVCYANDEGETALFVSTFKGFAEISDLLIEKGADPAVQTKRGWSILMAAAENGQTETLQRILDRGIDPDVAAVDGSTALMFAASNRHEHATKLLLEKGANPNLTRSDGDTALNMLVASLVDSPANANFDAIMELLLQHGADPNIHDSADWPPLFVVTYRGELNATKLLLAHGADSRPGSLLVYPLFGAILNGHDDVVSVLLESGASPNYKNKYDTTLLHYAIVNGSDRLGVELIRHGADVHMQSLGKSPAFEAASYGRILTLAAILEAGGDPNWVGAEGLAPLHIAAQNDNASAVELLLRAGANPNIHHPESTPLLIAVSHDQELIVKLLLTHKADPNQRGGPEEVAPIHIAARRANLTVARLLLQAGANPNLPTKTGRVALQDAYADHNLEFAELLSRHGADLNTLAGGAPLIFLAAYQGFSDWVDLLLRLGADADRASVGGNTPLLVSLSEKHWPIALALTSHGVDVNRANERGATALAAAINSNNEDLVEALIARGADLNRLSPEGWTPLAMAIASKNIAVFQLLMRNGADFQRRDASGKLPLELAIDADQFLVARDLLRSGATASLQSISAWFSGETITKIQLEDILLYNDFMDMLKQQIQQLSTLANISPEHREHFAEVVRELAERLGAPDRAIAEQAAAPVEKQLPEKVPELYANRADRRENPEQFILRVYGDPAETGMTQPDLARLDAKLYQAYRSWKVTHAPSIQLAVKGEGLSALTPAQRIERDKERARERMRELRRKPKTQFTNS